MASSYRKIDTRIWSDDKFCRLSDDGKIIFIYVIACPHGHLSGIFILDRLYIVADIRWSEKRVMAAFREVVDAGMFKYDECNRVVFIHNFLKYDPLQNPNQVVSALDHAASLPKSHLVSEFADSVERFTKPFAKPFVERFRERFGKLQTTDNRQQTTDAVSGADAPCDSVPIETPEMLQAAWNDICRSLPSCSALSDKRRTHCRARLKQLPLAEWGEVFRRIEKSEFCCGSGPTGWKATFDWIIQSPDNVLKVKEGKYDNKIAPSTKIYSPPKRKCGDCGSDDAPYSLEGRPACQRCFDAARNPEAVEIADPEEVKRALSGLFGR